MPSPVVRSVRQSNAGVGRVRNPEGDAFSMFRATSSDGIINAMMLMPREKQESPLAAALLLAACGKKGRSVLTSFQSHVFPDRRFVLLQVLLHFSAGPTRLFARMPHSDAFLHLHPYQNQAAGWPLLC